MFISLITPQSWHPSFAKLGGFGTSFRNRAKWGASLRLAPHFGFFKGFLSYIRGLYTRLTPFKDGIFMTSIPFNCGVFIQADSFQPLSIMTAISRNPDKRNYFFIFRNLTSREPVLRFITVVIQFLTIGR
jgi:hypothetical protein